MKKKIVPILITALIAIVAVAVALRVPQVKKLMGF